MPYQTERATGRSRIVVLLVLALVAIALYFYSERAAPPEPEPVGNLQDGEAAPANARPLGDNEAAAIRPLEPERPPVDADDLRRTGDDTDRPPTHEDGGAVEGPSPEVSLEQSGARLRVALAERLAPEQLERVVSRRLIERLVATIHSLDGEPVPLRFRPLAHVPDLPRIESRDDVLRLPDAPDPRYVAYRDLFDRLDAATLASLYRRHEDAFDAAWRALGESTQPSFRLRLIEVLEHLATFEPPATRPRLVRPEVLYEFADPSLEALSWGRKILVRVGPEHADAIRSKARLLAAALGSRP